MTCAPTEPHDFGRPVRGKREAFDGGLEARVQVPRARWPAIAQQRPHEHDARREEPRDASGRLRLGVRILWESSTLNYGRPGFFQPTLPSPWRPAPRGWVG